MDESNCCPTCKNIVHVANPHGNIKNDTQMQAIVHQILLNKRETTTMVSPETISKECSCPICLQYLEKTLTSSKCLHRFCSKCIVKALRVGNKSCPICREGLVSKRSLRADEDYDSLISQMVPNPETAVKIIFRPHPAMKKTQAIATRFLETSPNITGNYIQIIIFAFAACIAVLLSNIPTNNYLLHFIVEMLRKYLSGQEKSHEGKVDIYVKVSPMSSDFHKLNGIETLREVQMQTQVTCMLYKLNA